MLLKGNIISVFPDVGAKIINYAGKRLTNIVIEHRVENQQPRSNRSIQWHAICICGKAIIVDSKQIKRTPNISCGCKRQNHSPLFFKDPKHTNINASWNCYKRNAHNRNIDWQLTKEEFQSIIFKNCHYCGTSPSIKYNVFGWTRRKKVVSEQAKQRQENGLVLINGIDRVDNKKGYSLDNCVACCKHCNVGKLNQTKEEFLQWINRVWTYQNKLNVTQ